MQKQVLEMVKQELENYRYELEERAAGLLDSLHAKAEGREYKQHAKALKILILQVEAELMRTDPNDSGIRLGTEV